MAVVTVLGATGEIAVPFKSAINQSFAQQLANQISTAITGGTLTAGTPNPPSLSFSGTNQIVIGGTASVGGAPNSNYYPLTNAYVAVVNNANSPVTVSAGIAPVAPMSVLAGTGGTTFLGNSSTIGGTIAFGGGANTISGAGTFNSAATSANGGLQGNWTISTGSSAPGSSDDIYLASGSDTVMFGANDTIHAGGASVHAMIQNTDSADPTYFIGSADSTVFGGASANVVILGNGGATGGGVYGLGTGGNGVIAAGGGNSTLIGGSTGDVLFASSAAGAQAVMYAGAGNETLQGGFSGGSSTLYGGVGTGANDVLAAGNGGSDVIAAGSGNDTIFTGLGADSIWFYAPNTAGGTDIVNNFQVATSSLILDGYGGSSSYKVTSAGSAPLTITLSDNTTITFTGVSTSAAGSLKITTIS